MINEIKSIWGVFTQKQKSQIKSLQVFVLIISLFEIGTIAIVAGFMHAINNLDEVVNHPVLNGCYQFFNYNSNSVIVLLSIFVVLLLSISSLCSVYITKKINYSAFSIGREISVKLFNFYQNKNWIYHTQVNSSKIINRTLTETNRLTTSVLLPLLLMVSRVVLILMITVSLLIYNPLISIGGALLCVLGYYILFVLSKARLSENSKMISNSNQSRIRNLNESFECIKQVILMNKQAYYTRRYENACVSMANGQASTVTLGAAPRYMMEWLAYVGVILLLLFFIVIQDKEATEVIPVLTLYGISIFKLLPAMQQAYSNLATMKGNLSVVSDLSADIISANDTERHNNGSDKSDVNFRESFELKNISFIYPGKDRDAIKNVNIKIMKNQCVGFVGPSGSGKSTLIDIVSGLIDTGGGDFTVDGVSIKSNLISWRRNIAYVPQTIVLTDSSIMENIAFGTPVDEIDKNQISKVIKQAHLEDLIGSLEDGIHTVIGERGVQLSGGQRQRIGIARALYNDTDILVFDEATSALDGISEKMIMEAINELSGSKTIIMIAHRLKTVESCDCIYFMKDGQLEDHGRYSELLDRNDFFSRMVSHG